MAVRPTNGYMSFCHILRHEYQNISTSNRSYGMSVRAHNTNVRYIIGGNVNINGNTLAIAEYMDGDGGRVETTSKIYVYYKI